MYTKMFSADGSQLTRPANTTQYAANDSISDNATVGSVTALVADCADSSNQPVCIEEVLIETNDTGIGASGGQIRVHLYRSDPTANSGVKAGDNAAWSNNQAGWVGSLTGTFTAFADGGRARCVPDAGSYIIVTPLTGGKLWFQHQTLSTPTPSANSTVLQTRIKGFQGRT